MYMYICPYLDLKASATIPQLKLIGRAVLQEAVEVVASLQSLNPPPQSPETLFEAALSSQNLPRRLPSRANETEIAFQYGSKDQQSYTKYSTKHQPTFLVFCVPKNWILWTLKTPPKALYHPKAPLRSLLGPCLSL